jgi:FkbM family methyltransferase
MPINSITDRRKLRLGDRLLRPLGQPVIFVDVGSGGPLKHPWTLLPTGCLEKVDFDPEALVARSGLPLCISNAEGDFPFFVARDPRGSSLHEPNPEFVRRFGQEGMLTARAVQVRCVTLDQHFRDRIAAIDVLDINTEGHDLQVLQGATELFRCSFVKLVKIEFELAPAWRGQGWFADIDQWLRQRGYEIVGLELDHLRPAVAQGVYHIGEPVWGKALYMPGSASWRERLSAADEKSRHAALMKGVALSALIDAPGRAIELLQTENPAGCDAIIADVGRTFQFARVDAWRAAASGRIRRLLGAVFR